MEDAMLSGNDLNFSKCNINVFELIHLLFIHGTVKGFVQKYGFIVQIQ